MHGFENISRLYSDPTANSKLNGGLFIGIFEVFAAWSAAALAVCHILLSPSTPPSGVENTIKPGSKFTTHRIKTPLWDIAIIIAASQGKDTYKRSLQKRTGNVVIGEVSGVLGKYLYQITRFQHCGCYIKELMCKLMLPEAGLTSDV